MADDTLRQTPEVIEAVRRLPADTYNQRAFRIKRALDLSLKHRILPTEQWTKFEEVSGSDSFSRNVSFLGNREREVVALFAYSGIEKVK